MINSAAVFGLRRNIFIGDNNKKRFPKLETSLLGYPDSNQERQDQNLQCYHYTIAQCSNAMQRYNFFLIKKYFRLFFA